MTSAPIVGMHFRPPAKALLACLPGGATLILEAEPSNEYDSNAVAVYVEPSQFPKTADDDLSLQLPAYGFSLEEVRAAPRWKLGFIARTHNASLAGHLARLTTDSDLGAIPARLGFDAAGKPMALWEV